MDFEQILTIIITTVLVPLLSWGVSVLIKLADAKIAQIKNQTIRQAFYDAKRELAEAVKTAVSETQQVFVDAIKADGQFDKIAAEKAFNMSFDRVKEIMSDAAMEMIEDMTHGLNQLITAEIEKTVSSKDW